MARKYSKKASAKVARAMKKRKAGTLKTTRVIQPSIVRSAARRR